jgi:hypothetical protein
MTRFRQCLWGFAVAVLASVGACGGKDGKPSVLPCVSGALLHAQLSPTVASMTAPAFSVCRNDTCYPWTPSPLPKSGSGGTSEYITDKALVLATLWRNSDGSVTLDVEWRVSDPADLHDGDRYAITLANGSGAPVPVFDGIATYVSTTSTGLDSGAACVEAKLSA